MALADDVLLGTFAHYVDAEGMADLRVGPVLVGTLLAALLTFFIVATVLFFVPRAAARFRGPTEEETPHTEEVLLLGEIRDLLVAQQRPQPGAGGEPHSS